MIWFTSDTHFGHQRTLELSKRPFRSVKEMDWEMIKRWNMVVEEEDTVYHLGDFGNPEMIFRLNATEIYLVPGNYDDGIQFHDARVTTLKQEHALELPYKTSLITNKTEYETVKLIHEPLKSNNEKDFYLFGHIHKLQMVKRNGLNVGVDCHNFTPINLETVWFYYNAIIKHYDENVFIRSVDSKSLK